MKKSFFKIVVTVFSVILLSSCAASHYGVMSDSASLGANNFKMVKYAKGEASVTKVFGLGGMGKDALVAEAKTNLVQNNPLKEGQALANITVDVKNSFILFVTQTKVTVTADIVEFK
ncbi:MAG TPA: hypothetical protein PLD74_13395 [Prolixibacteraceae bacterium]|jgi:hypothetical protein|nr:hypothetical protein [Prolixibacteraceae bacterium]HOS00841.1 hypothetical protein [Prolixibacteraceae bacterium]HOS90574.1 hypothetical protein [Prolixibacteraceae bacterium]HQE53345.1 hypothetical protein [Prolixibacteraceae bacterium]HQH77302.1 hypothetical protein [Prolixibacteraceae bacterium]